MIKGSLLFSTPIVKRFRSKKIKSRFGQILMVLGDKWEFNIIFKNIMNLNNLNLNNLNITQKGTSWRDFTSFELSHIKIHQHVWPVGESKKTGINK